VREKVLKVVEGAVECFADVRPAVGAGGEIVLCVGGDSVERTERVKMDENAPGRTGWRIERSFDSPLVKLLLPRGSNIRRSKREPPSAIEMASRAESKDVPSAIIG
jgi:hypothetical protein